MDKVIKGKLGLIKKIKNYYLDFCNKLVIKKNEKTYIKNFTKNKSLEPINDFINLVNKTYLKKFVYQEAAKSFLSRISEYEVLEIDKHLKELNFNFNKNISKIRFYLIHMNAEHLFEGYVKRLKFYNFKTKLKLNKEKNTFYNNLYKLIKEEEND